MGLLLRARVPLFFAIAASAIFAACGGSSSTGLFGAPCVDGGSVCTEPSAQEPTTDTPDSASSSVDAASDAGTDGPVSDGATFGPCRRDVECTTGICNWALELCAVAAPNGAKCRRDAECASKLCNWESETCSNVGALGSACRRDVECATSLCNWKLEVCSTKQPKGGACRRDDECATGVCNQALDTCQ